MLVHWAKAACAGHLNFLRSVIRGWTLWSYLVSTSSVARDSRPMNSELGVVQLSLGTASRTTVGLAQSDRLRLPGKVDSGIWFTNLVAPLYPPTCRV